jgi:hypothetical protein
MTKQGGLSGDSDDWKVLVSALPENWQELAIRTDAFKGLRGEKTPEQHLRVLLLHLANGYSLRETALRAKAAGLAELSDVGVLKRLRKSEEWLYELCREMMEQNQSTQPGMLRMNRRVQLVDATHISEPGKSASVWRVHYSLNWPSLRCDYFKLTPIKGKGHGESLSHIPVRKGDCLIADRGYSTANGLCQAVDRGAELIVRFNPQAIRLLGANGQLFDYKRALGTLSKPGAVGEWSVSIVTRGGRRLEGRLCVIRKSAKDTQKSEKKLHQKAYQQRIALTAETLLYAGYIIVFTTLSAQELSAQEVLHWYRLRWQIELLFKRFKQLAAMSQLPKTNPDSARAWLYGKLLVALLTETLSAQAESVSP